MLQICEKYANDHNFKFSTDPNPKNCKTKCIAFMKKKKKDLSGLRICGNNLPWVESGKHLGVNLNDKSDCLRYDIKIKRAQSLSISPKITSLVKSSVSVIQEHNFISTKSISWITTLESFLKRIRNDSQLVEYFLQDHV